MIQACTPPITMANAAEPSVNTRVVHRMRTSAPDNVDL
jgi:hypothetical protein